MPPRTRPFSDSGRVIQAAARFCVHESSVVMPGHNVGVYGFPFASGSDRSSSAVSVAAEATNQKPSPLGPRGLLAGGDPNTSRGRSDEPAGRT